LAMGGGSGCLPRWVVRPVSTGSTGKELRDERVKVEVVVDDGKLQTALDAIVKAAHTGQIGDGKIFVSSVDDCVRIRTGETGKDAIG